jgi:hypothetical protein
VKCVFHCTQSVCLFSCRVMRQHCVWDVLLITLILQRSSRIQKFCWVVFRIPQEFGVKGLFDAFNLSADFAQSEFWVSNFLISLNKVSYLFESGDLISQDFCVKCVFVCVGFVREGHAFRNCAEQFFRSLKSFLKWVFDCIQSVRGVRAIRNFGE